ncbi:MAG: hypothetical protein O2931_13340 [Planctomycetota bacterium]|nr:hypothetical protein [Planctomycetota bacterium]MDA1179767.1 hypothetical protein [Planctomycetota bacterium]
MPEGVGVKKERAGGRNSWSRAEVNFALDSLLLLLFLLLLWVSTVIRFVFPLSSDAVGWRLWGLSLDHWVEIQFGLMATLALAILLHVMLHWSWVCGVVAHRLPAPKGATTRSMDDGTRTIVGVGLMIVCLNVMGLALAAAVLSIKSP